MTAVGSGWDLASDAELITAVRAGDSSAFGVLYERHAPAARSVARQYSNSHADAEDAVADAFSRVFAAIRSGRGPDVAFRAYLFTVLRRVAMQRVESGRRAQPTDDLETFEAATGLGASTEEPALQDFERGVVSEAFRSLPERWQAVLWYTEVEQMSPADIAPVLGLTANGVAALAYRAREGLRQAYLQQHLAAPLDDACRIVNAKLGSYVRGGLAKRETALVESHVDECLACRALVLELGDVNHGMRLVIAPLVLGAVAWTVLEGVGFGGAVSAAAAGAGAGAGAAAAGQPVGAGSAAGVGGGGAGSTAGSGAAVVSGSSTGVLSATAGVAATSSTVGAGVGAATGLAALLAAVPLGAAAAVAAVVVTAGLVVAGATGLFAPDGAAVVASDTAARDGDAADAAAADGGAADGGAADGGSGDAVTGEDPGDGGPGRAPVSEPTTVPAADAALPPVAGEPSTDGQPTPDDTAPAGTTPGAVPGGSPPRDGPTDPGPTDPDPSDPGPTDPDPSDPGPTDPDPSDPPPYVALTVAAPRELDVLAGTPTLVTLDVTNTGTAPAEEIRTELEFAAGTTWQLEALGPAPSAAGFAVRRDASDLGGWTCAPDDEDPAHRGICAFEGLAPGATTTLRARLVVEPGSLDGQSVLPVSLRTWARGRTPRPEATPMPGVIRSRPAVLDAELLLPDGATEPLTHEVGRTAVVRVTNRGGTTARAVAVAVAVPAPPLTVAGGGWEPCDAGLCRTVDVAAGGVAEIGITLTAPTTAPGTDAAVPVTVTVAGRTLTGEVRVVGPPLPPRPAAFAVTVAPVTALADGRGPIEVTVANTGELAAAGTRVVLELAGGLSVDDAQALPPGCTAAGQGANATVLCEIGDLAGGTSETVRISLVAQGAGAERIVTVTASGEGVPSASATTVVVTDLSDTTGPEAV